VTDNSSPDTDSTAGEFQLDDLVLGTYTIRETVAPVGYALDPDTETVALTLSAPSGQPLNNGSPKPFIDPALFKLVVLTCNTSTEQLVVSGVDYDPSTTGGLKDSLGGAGLTDAQQAYLCGLGGATYDNLNRGVHSVDVTIPKP
jgi:hypothetical protein